MLIQQHLSPPLTITVKSSLFTHVHSSQLSLAARLPYFAVLMHTFLPKFLRNNKDVHYTWVVPEISCICCHVLCYLLHKISCTIIHSKINAKIPLKYKKQVSKYKQIKIEP